MAPTLKEMVEDKVAIFNGHRGVARCDGAGADHWLTFTCAHCSATVSGAVISFFRTIKWLQCPVCGNGSVRSLDGNFYPAPAFGAELEGLPAVIQNAYSEARRCMSVSAYTDAELVSRKILMHVAVNKGADPGKRFVDYIEDLATA